jgi:hypothetical protein
LEVHKTCGYFSDEELAAKADDIMRWASDPSVMDQLAAKVEDVEA